MGWVARHHTLERRENFQRSRFRLAVERPELPGAQIHHRLGRERRHVQVVRKASGGFAHCAGERRIERLLAVRPGGRNGGVAFLKRLDQRLLDRACIRGEPERLPRSLMGGLRAVGQGGQVDVGPERIADSPPTHCTARIEPCGVLEGSLRLIVVEGPDQAQALVEVLLRLGRGRCDLAMELAEVVEERGRFGSLRRRLPVSGVGRRRLLAGGLESRRESEEEEREEPGSAVHFHQ
jgi:hypothetical protein